MPRRRLSRVDEVRVVLFVPRVQLKQELARAANPVIEIAMLMFRKRVRLKQLGIPATAFPDISDRNERLRPDGRFLRAREFLLPRIILTS
jgi:hypothetical protein